MPFLHKIILSLVSFLAVLSSLSTLGQTKTTDTLVYRSPYADLRPISCTVRQTLDSSGQRQGVCRIEGSDEVRQGGSYNEQHYSESRTYRNGILDGPFAQSFRHTGHGNAWNPYKVRRHWTADGTFRHGHPDGKWRFAIESSSNAGGEASTTRYTYTLEFDNGTLQTLDDNQGHRLQFHSDGTVSGRAVVSDGGNRSYRLVHSVVTDSYETLDGGMEPLPSRLDSLLTATMTPFDRTDRGYAVEYGERKILQVSRCCDIIDRYVRLTALDTGLRATPLTRVGVLREVRAVADDAAFDYYVQSAGAADRLLSDGYYERRHRKYYISSKAEARIREHLTKYQSDQLSHKLLIIASLMDKEPWDTVLAECRSGRSPLLDMVAAQWGKVDFEGQCDESAEMLDRAFRPLYPLRGFRIASANYEPYKGLKAEVEFYVVGADSIRYKSVTAVVQTTPTGHILVGRLDPRAYRTIGNVWDTIDERERWLNARHQQILDRKDVDPDELREYRDEYETLFDDTTILPEVRLKDLRLLEELQNRWLRD